MNLQFYLEKLHSSENYEKFVLENEDCFPCSAFFILDKETDPKKKENKDKQHIDFFVPSKNQAFSFQLENDSKLVPVDTEYTEIPEKIDLEKDIDFNEIEKTIAIHMEKENVKNKIQQILLSFQRKDGKDYFVGTVFISGFGLIKINIDLESLNIVDFEKKSFFDMLKITGREKDKEDKD